eukprot:4573895-Amphidinium_carterae.1
MACELTPGCDTNTHVLGSLWTRCYVDDYGLVAVLHPRACGAVSATSTRARVAWSRAQLLMSEGQKFLRASCNAAAYDYKEVCHVNRQELLAWRTGLKAL